MILSERFVLVPLRTAGAGDAGMFLPIFTSEEHFAKTSLVRENRLAKFPFDAFVRQFEPTPALSSIPVVIRATKLGGPSFKSMSPTSAPR